MALQGSFSHLTARIPTNLWEMLNDYARKNTGNNRSLALERILREWQAWDIDVRGEIQQAKLVAFEQAKEQIDKDARRAALDEAMKMEEVEIE